MHIAVTGSSGFIGSALVNAFTASRHRVTRLVRSQPPAGSGAVAWDPSSGLESVSGLEGVEAIVHLAGENLASGRWTSEKQDAIRDSRVLGTRRLCESLTHLSVPPSTLVCASAIGYYGNRGDERLTEASASGTGFLAEACREWEAACQPALQRGLRVVHIRLGMVLSPTGGAMARLLLPFRLGVGGRLGRGTQWMSWIALDDVIGSVAHVLSTPALRGPVNLTTPNPVTNREFTATLGRVLRRPTVVPAPAFALRLALGPMADDLLLASTRVLPSVLLASQYAFRFPQLEGALRYLLAIPT